jgi:hypothetical protein|nr:MAG TPA: protein of unknown function DUF4325 [Caudoviricetes sp.]DAY16232.1 MAG TPA: protein of unknown function DUF4325 [Caudoviricetes sp.]
MNNKNIDLKNYKNSNSTVFTGRPQGKDVREKLKLNELDKDDGVVNIIIPKGTTSFNPSFYLGLLYDSFKNLGEDFDNKYKFVIEDDDQEIRRVIEANLEDGKRNAFNSLNNNLKKIF